jgi:GH3 auxin-responsive promoter
VEPWYAALADPKGSQERVLTTLLEGYSKTSYGQDHGASGIDGIDEYRASFPVANYRSLLPYFRRVQAGESAAMLSEPAKLWVMTRGSTGASKVLPATETHLSQILEMGARCVVNFALKKNREVIETPVLNLNFPSEVHEIASGGRLEKYGYSSGTYAKVFPSLQGARLVPDQRDVDSLGGGITRKDWERRFELAYESAKGEDVGSLMGVTPVMTAFAAHLKRRHGVRPREIWKPRALFCTSVAKIHTRYEAELRYHYGPSPVVEMYTATEGVFAQQLDDFPYVSPNYDGYLFEVAIGGGFRLLHELRANEWGRLVVSTTMLPRYEIGDLIEAAGKDYFRVFGRDRAVTRAEHLLFNILSLRF